MKTSAILFLFDLNQPATGEADLRRKDRRARSALDLARKRSASGPLVPVLEGKNR